MTTIDEPIVVRALPGYEPTPSQRRKPGLARRRLRLVDEPKPQPAMPAEELPAELRDRIWQLLGQVLEAIDGRRPVGQLRPHFTRQAFAAVETRARGRAAPNRSRPLRLHFRQPADGVVEACGLVEIDARPRAVAARFELRERMRCTVFRVL
ncbi:Rv3235 family protein [Kutzneria chonburiensis]|uniref:Rv3235 family protein n=1 Tax=Kutzneria chonburiensis TaxID=1483604 RepID=A0ABV6MV66_9PSEU|nr:Rv3235 family protein [Kutzneria chonburiensis]